MVYKRISTKKTHTGYSIHVFVKDGELVKPLYYGIQRFFDAVDKNKNCQKELPVAEGIDRLFVDLKEAKVEHETNG